MEQPSKSQAVNHVRNFLPKAEQRWYSRRGIPHRIGHLYYGPPGTGKSSFALALAGKFNLTIYKLILSDPNLTDGHLESLLDDVPDRCILLIEDIDAYEIAKKRSYTPMEKNVSRSFTEQKKLKITLSGLLNALDGVTSKDGIFLIMTTNHPENLDEALIRPGRVDKRIAFNLLKKQGSYDMFIQMYREVSQFRN